MGLFVIRNFPLQTLISQRTKIPNLFMTGQNINSHGILGVTIGAIITCAEFIGINQIIKDNSKRKLVDKLFSKIYRCIGIGTYGKCCRIRFNSLVFVLFSKNNSISTGLQ